MGIKATLQALSMVAMIALLPPFFWHLKTKNMPALTMIVWLFLYNLKTFVDATVWSKDIIGLMTGWDGKGWCDLMIYIDVGAYVAIPCCICRIALQLTNIIKAESILPDKNRVSYIVRDLVFVNFLPFLCMLMSYFIQINRYGLVTYNGCQPFFSATWVTLILYSIWPFIVSTLGSFLSFKLLYIFYKKRKDASDILHCTESGLTLSRFSRFIFFCLLIILIMFPVSIYNFVNTCQKVKGRYSYRSYHKNGSWWAIPKIDTSKPFYSVWIYITMAYCCFLIFGTSSDALAMYLSVIKKMGFKTHIENWERKRKEKKQEKVNKMLRLQILAVDKENESFYNKAETPIKIGSPASDITDASRLHFYDETDLESYYLNNKQYNLDTFEVDDSNLPHSQFQYPGIDMSKSSNKQKVAVHSKHNLDRGGDEDPFLDHSNVKGAKNNDEFVFHYQIQKKKK